MVYYLKVTAQDRKSGEVKIYDHVYDIGHYYVYNDRPDLGSSVIRLLIKNGDTASYEEAPQREYINLLENDVEITLDVETILQDMPQLQV